MINENKQCKICSQIKSIENFTLTTIKNKSGTFYRKILCKLCDNRKARDRNSHIGLIEKICSKCKTLKTIKYFYKGRVECKDCYYIYKNSNNNKISLQKKQYYIDNKNCILNRCYEYRKNNFSIIKEKSKKYRYFHKENFEQYYRIYKVKNKDLINKRVREYLEKRKKYDIGYKIKCSLRTSLWASIVYGYKYSSAIKLLGISIEDFKKYIQQKWQSGMNWQNWGKGNGKWNLDHILPIELFDLKDFNQQKICFHYTNFQPLWEKNNLEKNDFLANGIRAKNLTPEQKLECLKFLGFNF